MPRETLEKSIQSKKEDIIPFINKELPFPKNLENLKNQFREEFPNKTIFLEQLCNPQNQKPEAMRIIDEKGETLVYANLEFIKVIYQNCSDPVKIAELWLSEELKKIININKIMKDKGKIEN